MSSSAFIGLLFPTPVNFLQSSWWGCSQNLSSLLLKVSVVSAVITIFGKLFLNHSDIPYLLILANPVLRGRLMEFTPPPEGALALPLRSKALCGTSCCSSFRHSHWFAILSLVCSV